MHDLFDPATRQSLLDRLDHLAPDSARQWGKMDPAQMCAHCAAALAVATDDTPRQRALIGRLLGWMVRKKLLGEAPFPRSSPTDPTFVFNGPCDFAAERERLREQIGRFAERGPARAAEATHTFLGKLSGEEWGVLMGKHLDHHLQQFGV